MIQWMSVTVWRLATALAVDGSLSLFADGRQAQISGRCERQVL